MLSLLYHYYSFRFIVPFFGYKLLQILTLSSNSIKTNYCIGEKQQIADELIVEYKTNYTKISYQENIPLLTFSLFLSNTPVSSLFLSKKKFTISLFKAHRQPKFFFFFFFFFLLPRQQLLKRNYDDSQPCA